MGKTVESILPLVVEKVTAEWADERSLELPAMYSNGESFAEVCTELGITKEKYKEACKLSESFSAADKYSQVVHEAWWNKTGREKGVSGRSINGAIWNHNMNNRYGWSNNGGTDDGSKGRTLNLGIVFVGNGDKSIANYGINNVLGNQVAGMIGRIIDQEPVNEPIDVPTEVPAEVPKKPTPLPWEDDEPPIEGI